MQPRLHAAILIGGCLLAIAVHLHHQSELDEALARHREEAHADAILAAERVEDTFRRLYEGLRTMARLPGVRRIAVTREELTGDARVTIQEIYNNLAASVAMSEVYFLPVDFDPDQIDPTTGELQVPLMTFDELIVGRHAEEEEAEEAPELEEIEIFEYRLMRDQLRSFRLHHANEAAVEGLDYPALTGPEVVTCDNSRFSPSAPDDRDRSGLVYSVPYFGLDGRLAGAVAGVVLTPALRDAIPGGGFALYNATHGWFAGSKDDGPWREARAEIESGKPNSNLLYAETIPLRIVDVGSTFVLWSGRADADYWSRSDVVAARRAAGIGHFCVLLLSLGGCALVHVQHQRRQLLQRRRDELETEVAARTAELVQARLAAEAASQSKSAFLANMSHEIRTPINGVMGMLELLADSPLDVRQRGWADTARSCAGTLLRVINDILDFSKIEAGKLELEEIDFEPRRVLSETVAVFDHRAADKALELVSHVAQDVPLRLRGDPTRLRQVLFNLIGNAIKFTEAGSVEVRLTPCPLVEPRLRMRFEVVDTGIGLSETTQQRLFEPFSQADASTTRRFGGTGLGLSISRRLVEQMGGTFGVSSRLGEGSLFWFEIPFASGQAQLPADSIEKAPSSDPERSETPSFAGRSVLLVEDNEVNRRVALAMLEPSGAAIHVARDGREAVAATRERHFDAILMDCQMPEMDGLEATRRIRDRERLDGSRRQCIIAMTANAMTDDEALCRQAGMDDYLSKPIDRRRLYEMLSRWLVAGPTPPSA